MKSPNQDPCHPDPEPIITGKGGVGPGVLPVGWSVTEFPSTFDIHDHTGRVVTCFPKPYDPIPLGTLIAEAMEKLAAKGGAKPMTPPCRQFRTFAGVGYTRCRTCGHTEKAHEEYALTFHRN